MLSGMVVLALASTGAAGSRPQAPLPPPFEVDLSDALRPKLTILTQPAMAGLPKQLAGGIQFQCNRGSPQPIAVTAVFIQPDADINMRYPEWALGFGTLAPNLVGTPAGTDSAQGLKKMGFQYWIGLSLSVGKSGANPFTDMVALSGHVDKPAFLRWAGEPTIEIVLLTEAGGLWLGYVKAPSRLPAADIDRFIRACDG